MSAIPGGAGSELEPLLARLDALAFRLDRGECPPADEMAGLADAAARLGPALPPADRPRLARAVARVGDALTRSTARLRDRIVTTSTGRRAARAYAGTHA